MSKSDYIKKIEGAERRFVANPIEVIERAEGDTDTPVIVTGYAAKFNKRTMIGSWFEEEILPGAFDDVLGDDVRCLKNHDPSLLLARSTGGEGTLKLEVDAIGLKYTFTIPDRSVGRDLENELETGDLTQSSFSFTTEEVVWVDRENEPSLRQVKKIKKLYDVSPVTFPAYADTSIGKRAFDAHENAKEILKNKNKRGLNIFDAQHKCNLNNK